jgi:hypothetical protein
VENHHLFVNLQYLKICLLIELYFQLVPYHLSEVLPLIINIDKDFLVEKLKQLTCPLFCILITNFVSVRTDKKVAYKLVESGAYS